MGGIIIAVGVFLVIFGAQFIKATIFLAGALSCLTLAAVVYFNIFTVESTTTVWIVFGVGLLIGVALGYFLIKITNMFFMILGGYMGYTLGIFLYNLVLNQIHADPKLVYWVTIIICVIIGAAIALWLVKHVLIFSTSICGGYAMIRGASLYIGSFPSESVVLDLIQHNELDQLDDMFGAAIYGYLAAWVIISVFGLWWQYRSNKEKDNDDYRKMKN